MLTLQHYHLWDIYTLSCILSRGTRILILSHIIPVIISHYLLCLRFISHSSHSQNSFIPWCLMWNQWLITSPEFAGLKMRLKQNFCSGCWMKLNTQWGMWWGRGTTIIFPFSKAPLFASVAPLTSCSTASLEPASPSLDLMRPTTVFVTSELSACNIFLVCVLANVICAHMSVTPETGF